MDPEDDAMYTLITIFFLLMLSVPAAALLGFVQEGWREITTTKGHNNEKKLQQTSKTKKKQRSDVRSADYLRKCSGSQLCGWSFTFLLRLHAPSRLPPSPALREEASARARTPTREGSRSKMATRRGFLLCESFSFDPPSYCLPPARTRI